MKYRIETIIPFAFLGYIAFFPISNGQITGFFIKPNILVPFALSFFALTILSFGLDQLAQLGKALSVFFVNSEHRASVNIQTVNGAISFSYVSAMLWVLYILVLAGNLNIGFDYLTSHIALAFTYSFVLSELVLRPLKRRLIVLKE